MNYLGFVILSARQSNSLSLRDLAEMTDLSNSYISQLESGKVINPTAKTVIALSRSLNLSYRLLLNAIKKDLQESGGITLDNVSVCESCLSIFVKTKR